MVQPTGSLVSRYVKDQGLQDRASAPVTPGRVTDSETHARRGGGPAVVESGREDVAGLSPDYLASLLRLYDVADAGPDGYPVEWHDVIKHLIRAQDDLRCVRCGHPYVSGAHPMEVENVDGEERLVSWSPCDERCTHKGPIRYRFEKGEWEYDGAIAKYGWEDVAGYAPTRERLEGAEVEARYRILTVHHLDGVKVNCRWWNLASLCQRCHLNIQRRVIMGRVYPFEHSEWFKPYAAGFYAFVYLGEDLSRENVVGRLDELLALERLV